MRWPVYLAGVALAGVLKSSATRHLAPLGVRQKGRSRVWLDDRAWWLGVVEFQPSSSSGGSYLNLGAMWLWDEGTAAIAFHVAERLSGFLAYTDDEQFAPEADRLGQAAAAGVGNMRQRFRDIAAVAEYLSGRTTPADERHAGMAYGLLGDGAAAAGHLRRYTEVRDERGWARRQREDAERLISLAADSDGLRVEMEARIAASRARLGLGNP